MRKLFVALCVLAILAMLGWKISEPWREKMKQQSIHNTTSDAANIEHTITICGDEWLGYLIFRSNHFRRELEAKGIAANFRMEPDFKKRFAMLQSGECDFVCATIDSYLVNGRDSGYPGVIVFGIDESYGGDALIAGAGIETLDDLKSEGTKGAFVGYSPSEFLLKSQIAHFGLDSISSNLGNFRTDNADAAFKKLQSGEAQFAVLWEPLVSKAINTIPDAKRIMDTRQARGVIYDVAIASRELVAKKSPLVQDVTNAYFASLNHY
ncbi:MAG: hypothetical protein AAF226_05605, partial [Verrucomicrobiota bacterium]